MNPQEPRPLCNTHESLERQLHRIASTVLNLVDLCRLAKALRQTFEARLVMRIENEVWKLQTFYRLILEQDSRCG